MCNTPINRLLWAGLANLDCSGAVGEGVKDFEFHTSFISSHLDLSYTPEHKLVIQIYTRHDSILSQI